MKVLKKIFTIIGITFLLYNTGVLIYYILSLNNIENILRYFGIAIISLLVLFITMLTILYERKDNKLGKIGIILLFIIEILLGSGINFINYNLKIVNTTLNKITSELETISVSFVSLNENNNYKDIKNEKIGIVNELVSENINLMSKDIVNSFKFNNEIVEYNDFFQIADDLKNNKINYAILPSNYKDIYVLYEEYADISENIKVLFNKEKETEKEETVKKDITKPFSILLMGVDTLSSSYNADTLLVVTFNPETLTATMLSIPRDTYTTLANGAKHKINASGWAGDKSVQRTVSKYLGINIDYYVKLNFNGLVSLIDALGGVEVDVPYSFCEQDSHRSWGENTVYVEKGFQRLNGEQALALSRNRHYWQGRCDKKYTSEGTRNDFMRGQNQQLVLKSIMNSMKSINNLDMVYGILDTLGKNMTTNMSRDTILSFYNLGKTIIDKNVNLDLSQAIKINRLFFTSYIQTIRIGNMNLSTVGHYEGSVNEIKDALKENLGLKDKKVIKTIAFDINNPYIEKVIGKNNYTNKNAPVTMNSFVKKDISTLQSFATANGYELEIEYREITDSNYQNNAIISHNPAQYTDLSTVRNKIIKAVVAKVTAPQPFNYNTCLNEQNKDNPKCILDDYTNKDVSTFKSFINKTGISFNIDYKEVDGENNKIISQSIKNKSIYDIKNNNLTIEIKIGITN